MTWQPCKSITFTYFFPHFVKLFLTCTSNISTHTQTFSNDSFIFSSLNTYLPPELRFGGVVYWCPGRFHVCVSLFLASGFFSLSQASPPSSPAPPPSLPSSRASRHQLCTQDQPTFLGCQTSRLPLALLGYCCPSGCEEMGQCLTAEKVDAYGKYYKVLFPLAMHYTVVWKQYHAIEVIQDYIVAFCL